MLNSLTTSFVARLRKKDETAWYELWETFGPVLRGQLMRWGKGRIGPETVRDLSQETLAQLSGSIDRYDPTRGARFSTWLLAIARHVLGDEMDRRGALKRGSSKKAAALDESWMVAAPGMGADEQYEAAIFRSKVEAAIRVVERETDFVDFSIFRMRVLEHKSGKEVAEAVGISEPTVSRRLARVRTVLRHRLSDVITTYSFTKDELQEAERNGLDLNPTNTDDALFDEAIGEIYLKQVELRRTDEASMTGSDPGRRP